MQVSEIMHKGVTTVQAGDSLRHVASIMKKDVNEGDQPVAMVSLQDLSEDMENNEAKADLITEIKKG